MLLESDLNLARLALSLEGANKSSCTMHRALGTSTKTKAPGDKDAIHTMCQEKKKLCFDCGCLGHSLAKQHFKKATCDSCGKVGHIAPADRSKPTVKKWLQFESLQRLHFNKIYSIKFKGSKYTYL